MLKRLMNFCSVSKGPSRTHRLCYACSKFVPYRPADAKYWWVVPVRYSEEQVKDLYLREATGTLAFCERHRVEIDSQGFRLRADA